MNRFAIRAVVVALALPLAGCAELGLESVARAPAAEITADPSGDGTVYVRSTEPRLFGQVVQRTPGDPGPARSAALVEAARGAAAPEIVDAVRIPAPGEPDAGTARVALGPYTPERAAEKLAFGDVATVCGVVPASRGKEVDAGPGGFRLYDTAPGSLAARTYYLDGFADGCARRFTATLARLGTIEGHEATRYNPLNENPWSVTDAVYEAVKADVCGAPRGIPCDGAAARALSRGAAFVSVYQGFGPDGRWLEMFLHDGDLVTAEAR